MSRIHSAQKRLRNVAVVLVIALTLISGFTFAEAGGEPWRWFACYFASVNLVTWLYFFYDKRVAAKEGAVRVPENTLFLLSVAGGLPSTLVAMQVLRHKRAKASFKWKLLAWFVVVYAALALGYWFLGDELNALLS